jgi:4-hydroxy-4-methyl-2-oxoglutarate aldolase
MSITEPSAVTPFLDLDVATVYEASGVECALEPSITPVFKGAKVCGPAITVAGHPGDNLWMHHVVAAAEPGSVIVADVAGHLAGYWGEVLAVAAQARGIAGLVIDGGLRDTPTPSNVSASPPSAAVSRSVAPGSTTTAGSALPSWWEASWSAPETWCSATRTACWSCRSSRPARPQRPALERQANEAAAFPRLRSGQTTHEVFGIPAAPGP